MPNRKASTHKPLSAERARRVAVNLRTAREAAGMTQEEVAASAGVSVQLIRRIEAGTGNPTLGSLDAIATAVETDLASMIADR